VGEALKAVKGNIEDQGAFLQALSKVRFAAPRGPFRFDDKRNAIVTIYVREVRMVNGVLENVVTESLPNIDQFWKPKK
jgi:branched-chain amino acid transport system substrate-binding protein